MLEAVLDLIAAEEILRQIQPRTRRADAQIRRGIRLLYGQVALALDRLIKGHGVRRKHDVARRAAGFARLDARDRARGNGSARRRRDLADGQGVRLDLDGEGVGSERADFVRLFERDVAADSGEVRRRNLARRLVRRRLGVDNERLSRRKRHIPCEVDVICLECHVLPEGRIFHIDRTLRTVADGVMREVRAEYLCELIVRQLQVARRTVAKPDGLRAVVRSDAECARARDGRTAPVRCEVRDIVRIEVQRAALADVHDARAARVLDLTRGQRHFVVLAGAVRADLESARADDRLARLRCLDDDAVVRFKSVDRDRLAAIVAENQFAEIFAKELAVELVARDMKPCARRSVVERQIARRLARDDETALADDVRRIVVRCRRDDLIRMHAQSADGIGARVELSACVELQLFARDIDPDGCGAGSDLHLGILVQHDVAVSCIERRLCIVALDLQCSSLLEMDVARRLDIDLCAVFLARPVDAFHMDGLALLDGEAARDDRCGIMPCLRRICTDLELRTLALDGEIVAHLDAELARRVDGLLDRTAVEVDMLLTRDVEALKAFECFVNCAVGDAEICGRGICGIVADIDVLPRCRALRRDLAVLIAVDLAETEVDAAREVEVKILDGERIACCRQSRRMRLDLHVGLAVRARLRRARQCDVARGLNVRGLLEGRTLDIDVACLRCAADLDLAVGTVVDVPIARTRADVDRLRLRRLFERELLADVDLVISEVEIVGFDLRVVRGSQIARDGELFAAIHLDFRRLRLESVDVHLRRDGTILNDSDLHVRLVLELEIAVRHIGSDVFNLVRLRAEIHRAFAEKQQVTDFEGRTLGKTVA